MVKRIQLEQMKPSETDDLYKRLGIDRESSQEEILDTYRIQALRWHPDRNPDNFKEAHREFIVIGEAFEVLSNPIKRNNYDRNQEIDSFRKKHRTPRKADSPVQDTPFDFSEYNFYYSMFKNFCKGINIVNKKIVRYIMLLIVIRFFLL